MMIGDNSKAAMYFLKSTKHLKMNKKDKSCNEDISYSFTMCVQESISMKVGCRMEWNLLGNTNLFACNTTDEIIIFVI